MSDDSHLPTPLAHGRWAGDRVGRSAREAGASLQGRSSQGQRAASGTRVAAKRVAAARKAAESAWWQQAGLFWTVFPRGAVQNGEQLARIAARRDFVQRELATRLPSGKKRPGVRREVASKRSRGASGHFAPSAVTASAAVVAQPAAAIAVSATAVSVATTTAVAEPAAAAAVTDAAFAVPVAPPRSRRLPHPPPWWCRSPSGRGCTTSSRATTPAAPSGQRTDAAHCDFARTWCVSMCVSRILRSCFVTED